MIMFRDYNTACEIEIPRKAIISIESLLYFDKPQYYYRVWYWMY